MRLVRHPTAEDSALAVSKPNPYTPPHETVLFASRRVLHRRLSSCPDLDGGGEREEDQGGVCFGGCAEGHHRGEGRRDVSNRAGETFGGGTRVCAGASESGFTGRRSSYSLLTPPRADMRVVPAPPKQHLKAADDAKFVPFGSG